MNARSWQMTRASRLLLTVGFLLAAVLMVGPEGLDAQRPGGAQRAEMELRIQARFDDLVRDELGLSDDEVQRLQGTVEDFNGRRLQFFQSERNSRARVRRLAGPGGGGELTEQDATDILAEMVELSGQEATLFREEQEALLQILSSPQVVRLIMMRQQLGDRIRRLRGGGGRGRGSQGGRGPGFR